jgi:flavin reductase (DIM6/NTAB) family NADH-FMN oxidoreductase RutF
MAERHFYQPADGHGLAHDPLNAIVAPRPIGWVSTLSGDGTRNLAPYSFFNLFNYRPPIIGFSSVTAKDSLANARETGEFVWNLATYDLKDALNQSSAQVDRDVDEFDLSGLETAPSRLVKPPRVAASPVHFECRVSDIVQLKAASGEEVNAWLVLGEVVGVHIDPAMLEDGVYVTERARPIMRGGGPADYFEALPQSKFAMRRPD